jgi:hypothetical protein
VSAASITATREARARLTSEWTLRLLGQYVTFTGWQWLELHDLTSSITEDGQALRARIREHLIGPSDGERSA